VLVVSGYWMLFTTFGRFDAASPYIHLMQTPARTCGNGSPR
jgi:hypothetical protein